MNLSLRNLAMGAAIAVSSVAFAQEAPFTVTENYNRLMTGADFGISALGGDIRTATGVNGKSYALDKGTGQIYAIDATSVTNYASVDVNRGEDSDHVMLDITSDDAGNLLVAYAAGDFFANSLKGVAIVPADGSDVVYVDELEFPEGWVPGRVDVMGRIVGDMLSEDGAYLYLTGAGGDNKVACYWISEGYFEPQEYVSNEYKTAGASLTYAVPLYNFIDEQADVDPIYDGGVLFPWNGSGPEMIVDGACVTLPRATADDVFYSSTPGGDVLNYDGTLYYAIPYTTASGKRSGDFLICDAEGNIYFKTTNGAEGGLMEDLVATGSFINGGGLYIHPVAGKTNEFELFWWGGFNQGAICASYTITFPGGEVPPVTEPGRNAFAYGVAGTQNGTEVNISYTATAPALEAILVLTDVNDAEKVYEFELPAPVVGVNEVVFAIPEDLPGSQYTWAVKLASANNQGEVPALVLEKVGDPATTWGRGGVVTITDPAYASYGYTVVANSRGLGFDVYNPEGELVGNYKDEVLGTGNSCPLRGDQRFGKAVFSSWGDPNSGLYEFDPMNPEAGVKQIVEGERDANGTFTYNGVATVSSSPCVAFVGKGEETMMWTFDEDIYANTIVGYPIGNAETVTIPASIICNEQGTGWNSASLMLNTAVGFEPAPNGLFSAQNRANGMDQGVPAFIYMDNNGELIAKSADLMEDANYELPSCNGAVALSVNADILAVGSYNGVHFFAVTWEDNEPALSHIGDVEIATTTKWAQAKFDAGNNLHIMGVNISNYNEQVYAVVTLPIVSEATTAAPAESVINNASGVESVEVEAAEAVYYNLNGVRVAADQLTTGVYVKVAGTTATKVVVK